MLLKIYRFIRHPFKSIKNSILSFIIFIILCILRQTINSCIINYLSDFNILDLISDILKMTLT